MFSKPLIRFDGPKLVLVENDLPKKPMKVLSIIGKARMGKSTFLNTFITHYTGENSIIFTTQDGDEHCTLGINYYYIPEHNLLLLDSQGLAHENSSHDPSLLLFVYLVSNIIIFNESMMLQNPALTLIQPICTFTQYLDPDTLEKPSLIFRISDAKKSSDINKTLEKLMTPHPDQYNSIRESIANIFAQPVKIIKTEHPTSNDEAFLAVNDYTGLRSLNDNGFDNAIKTIVVDINSANLRNNLNLSGFVDNINNNEQITINKLDVVALTHNNDLLTWLNKVPAELKTEIEVNGTQEAFEKNVVTRQEAVKKLKSDFLKRFRAISDTIKKEPKAQLYAEIDGPIKRAIAASEEKAKNLAEAVGFNELMKPKYLGTIPDAGITKDASPLVSHHLGMYQRFQKAIVNLYQPVLNIYESMMNSMYAELNEKIAKAKEISEKQRNLVQKKANVMLEGFDKWLMEKINERDSSIVFEKNADIYNHYRSLKIVEFEAFIIKTVKKQDVTMAVVDGNKLNASIVECSGQVNTKYELIADIYSDFVNTVNTFPIKESGFDEFLIQTKEEFLVNKIVMNAVTAKKLYLTNPEIKFISDQKLLYSCITYTATSAETIPYILSFKTWTEVYEPMYVKAMENLVEDGLCAPTKTFRDFFSVETDVENLLKVVNKCLTRYEQNICEMLHNEMKKVFCRMTVSGVSFPTDFGV
jgi:GTPase SAR1 family protein